MKVGIEMTTFKHLYATYPEKRKIPLDSMFPVIKSQFLFAPKYRKEDLETHLRVFSMNEYKKNSKRGKENILSMTGAVFDFDNKYEFIEIEDATKVLKEKNTLFWWYTTGSHTTEVPRWRLVIPFSNNVPVEKWDDIYDGVLRYIGNPVGIDPASKRCSQVYRFPFMPENNNFLAKYHEGSLLNIDTVPITYLKPKVIKKKNSFNKDLKDSVTQALDHIDPDLPYEDWLKVGMSLHSELGNDGFSLWNHWSSLGNKYPKGRQQDLMNHWTSFKKEGINIGTLFHMAKENGFRLENITYDNLDPVEEYNDDSDNLSNEDVLDWESYADKDIFDLKEFPYLNPIFETFVYNSPKYNPFLFLGSTISISGFLFTNYYKSERHLNFYNMILALPGVGKGRIIKITKEIIKDFGFSDYWNRGCATIQGFDKELNRTNGIIYYVNDEISDFFRNIKNKNSDPNKKMLTRCWKELSCGEEYTPDTIKSADNKKYEKTSVSLLFVGTPSVFSELSTHDFTEGLLSRFLVFYEPSESLGLTPNQLKHLLERPISIAAIPKDFLQKKITLSSECENYIELFRQSCEKKYKESIGDDEKIFLLSRAPEAAYKLSCLTINEKNEIPLSGVKWAVSVVITSIKTITTLMEKHFGNSLFIQDKNKVLKVIKDLYYKKCRKNEQLTKRDIIRYTHLQIKTIDEILDYLSVVGNIRVTKVINTNKTVSIFIEYKGA